MMHTPIPSTNSPADPLGRADLQEPSGLECGGTGAAVLAPPALPSVATILPGLAPGGSLECVLRCRLDQIDRWGHTPEKDADRPVLDFLRGLQSYATAAREDHQFRFGHAQLRSRLVRLAALTLATIDRLDMEDPDETA